MPSTNPFKVYQHNMLFEKVRNMMLSLPHKVENFRKGEVVQHQGDPLNRVGLVEEGILSCSRYTEDGNEVIPHYFYPNSTFPEYLVFTNEDHYIYSLVATKKTRVLFVNTALITQLVYSDPEWARLFIAYMAHRGLLAEKWTLCNSYPSLMAKVAYMLIEIYTCPESTWFTLPDSQGIIAQKLHVTRPVYNQMLAKMEQNRFIERNKGKIRIPDLEALQDLI